MALFSGVGRLERAAHLVLGARYRTVCHVERDAYAAAVLVARMEDKALGTAPIWDDVSTFDGFRWRGLVDIISGGFPCQDISDAGARKGIREGKRSGLWFQYARIIGEMGPRYAWVENVGALNRRGLDIVLGSLADLGFDAEWITLRASDVGAAHGRKRLFILAHSRRIPSGEWSKRERVLEGNSGGDGQLGNSSFQGCERHTDGDQGRSVVTHGCASVANPDSAGQRIVGEQTRKVGDGRRTNEGDKGFHIAPWNNADGYGSEEVAKPPSGGLGILRQPSGCERQLDGRGEELADTVSPRHEGNRSTRAPWGSEPFTLRRDRAEIPLFAPGPGDRALWEEILANSPELSPSVKPRLRLLAHGMGMVVDKGRADQLRCSGNGVVDLQAAVALAVLAGRLGVAKDLGIDFLP